MRHQLTAWSLVVAVVASLVLVQACGSGGGGNGATCDTNQDNITAQLTQITVSSASLRPPTCEVVTTPGTQVVALSGGEGSAQFGSSTGNVGNCSFQQLGSASGVQKTAYFAMRDPTNPKVLFGITNGQATCTVQGAATGLLCGSATVYTDAAPFTSWATDCNNDPTVSVSVYRGGATLSLDKVAGSPTMHVGPNDRVSADPFKGLFIHSPPQFTPQEISLFDVQLDALRSGVLATDKTSVLEAKTLAASDVVVNPYGLQSANYGNVLYMCRQANLVPVLFYPTDISAKTPRVSGGVCSNPIARVYGVAIYRQAALGFNGAFYKEGGGGSIVRADMFPSPMIITRGSPQLVFPWDGSIGQFPLRPGEPSSTPRIGSPDVYVLKFLYDLPPDLTLRVGFVAVALFGAPYPGQIQ